MVMKYNQLKPLLEEIAGGFPFGGKPLGVGGMRHAGCGLCCCFSLQRCALCCVDGLASGGYPVRNRRQRCRFLHQVLGLPKWLDSEESLLFKEICQTCIGLDWLFA